MWMLIPLMMLLICLSGLTVRTQQYIANEQAYTEAAVTSDQMRIYLNTVQRYARTHPDLNGTVEESELALPAWLLKSRNMRHALVSGQVYVYYTSPPPRLIGYLSKSIDESARVGINQHGTLVGPRLPERTDHLLPPQIPEGSAVIMP